MSEKELIRRAQNGDFDAFNQLISDEKDKIYRLALKVTGNREDAQDILQETLLKAIEKIDTFRMESSFSTWLYAIALNNVRASLSTRKREALKPIDDYLPSDHGGKAELFEWGDPHVLFERKELADIVESALANMPHMYSLPFILRYMEEMPVKEVARALKLSEAATKSRILRARLALREQLSEKLLERTRGKM